MNSVQKTACNVIAQSLLNSNVSYPQDVDWQAVFVEMEAHAVESLPGKILKQLQMPAECLSIWKKRVISTYIRYLSITAAQESLCQVLNSNGIIFVIVKGLAASQYYPAPEFRTLGDVDFLVHPDDFSKAKDILNENGYQFLEDNGRHIEFRKKNVLFEMHRYFSKQGHTELDNLIWDGMSTRKWCNIGEVHFPCLPDYVNGLVILQHIRQHFTRDGGLGLRQIVDWMMFVDKCIDNERWHEFKEMTEKIGLTQLAITTTRMCQLYLSFSKQCLWCRDADLVACAEMMEFILDSGNFGLKRNQNETNVTTITRELRAEGFLKKLQQTGEMRWNALVRHPGLKPIAWLYGIYFYVKRGFEVGGVTNAVKGYRKGKRFDMLLKRMNLRR